MLPAPGGVRGTAGVVPVGQVRTHARMVGSWVQPPLAGNWGRMGPRMPVRSSWARLLLAALALLTVACSERGATLPTTPGTTAGTTAAGALPDGAPGSPPSPTTAPVAFVADGRAWATTGDGRRVWCLFEVHNPGPFLWGPRGDRVVLDGLEVRGVGAPVWRAPRGHVTGPRTRRRGR